LFTHIKKFASARFSGTLLAMGLGLMGLAATAAGSVHAQLAPAVAAKPASTPQKPGKPALWQVSDKDSTLYLLGSFHLLKPDTAWRGGQIDAAFTKSTAVYFEITDLDNTALTQQLIGKYGVSAAPDLTRDLKPQEVAQLKSALAGLGLPFEALQRLKPWLVALTITQQSMAKYGYAADAGVDLNLYRQAVAANKSVRAFETLEDQIVMMAAIGGDGGVDFLRQTLKEDAEGPQKLHELADAWLYGDEARLTRKIVTELKVEHPAMYQDLILRRNNAWMPQIKEIMNGSGTTLVVVGAGHIIGSDGLAAQLKAQGYEVKRIQ
jgi:uncharacterized protein